jgi:AraC family ethanolamine operon transcriptional activator
MISPPRKSASDLPKELREVSVVKITDPTAVGGSIEVLSQDIVNLGPIDFEFKRVTVPFEDCCLIYSRTNSALRTRTLVHDDFEACTILGPRAHGSVDGKELHPYAMIVAGPGTQAEVIAESNYESVALLALPQVLREQLALRRANEKIGVPDSLEVWHPAEEVARNLFELGTRIIGAAENGPEVFNDSHWARYGAQVEFMDSLLETMESCNRDKSVDTDKKGKSYSQIVKTCEDYTLNVEECRPYISELCAAANVSERTLQNAFKDIIGMSPMTYLNRLRLHRARDELRKATGDSTTVTDVAMNWGFWHFGEFSRAYKNCFGELPSGTLKRNNDDD